MDKITSRQERIQVVPIAKNACCGCTACVEVCPVHAISMQQDAEGFLYPSVQEEMCISCGRCVKTCAFANPKVQEKHITTAYVAKHKNDAVRMNSRSGGVFVAASDWILEQGGSVYGCILDKTLYARHVRAVSKAERDAMCKSKYVQSDMRGVIPQIIDDLKNDRYVLFSGTGCQVGGVIEALSAKKIDTQKLYTLDIVCHGCASPRIFEDYIQYIETKENAKVEAFDFRDKTQCGWDGHIETYTINGKKHAGVAYREIFHTDLCLRPSCYECRYACVERISDLTIADAWGIKTAKPDFNDNKGTSMFLVQNAKGEELLQAIKAACEVQELPLAAMMQPNLQRPSKAKGDRAAFWQTYQNGGIEKIVEIYGHYPWKKRIKAAVKSKVRQLTQSGRYFLP